MGYYIEGPARGKPAMLINSLGAEEVTLAKARECIDDPEKGVVCVVDNGPFEAAAFAYDKGELDAFADPRDDRLKRWFILARDVAEALSNFKRRS